jgi:2,4-dienoyl-CoA reductase-like NADH-dependent reductase (Old Yellow Enzyme family)
MQVNGGFTNIGTNGILQSNDRQDDYGGSAERRARIVIEIVQQIRSVVPASFCIGIKLNSADHNASDFEDTMIQIQLFSDAGVDFLEISGGSYEDPTVRDEYDYSIDNNSDPDR